MNMPKRRFSKFLAVLFFVAACLPVLAYADEYQIPEERVYRAVALSNLVAIHQKTGIGRLSAYCGAVSAGCAAG